MFCGTNRITVVFTIQHSAIKTINEVKIKVHEQINK